ncbi:hypothetical protein EZS27_034005, partial [termite gut metagenome]
GGRVSFIYGNHESMVLMNSLGYTNPKYTNLIKIYNGGTSYGSTFFNKNTELGRWLATCNTIEIIGTDLFVHAGLGQNFYDRNLDIDSDVNAVMSEAIFLTTSTARNTHSIHSQYLFSSATAAVGGAGPIWYRGMVGSSGHEVLTESTLDLLLQRYVVKRIIVGHTIHTDISTYYGGKVIDVNVDNQANWTAGRGRGILIENGKTYIVYDTKADKELQ